MTAIMVTEVMIEKKMTLSELVKPVEIYPQKLVNVRVKDKPAARADEDVIKAVDAVSEALGSTGRIYERAVQSLSFVSWLKQKRRQSVKNM